MIALLRWQVSPPCSELADSILQAAIRLDVRTVLPLTPRGRRNAMRRSVRRALVGALLVGGVTLIPATSASAHVHGITPLNQCSVVPSNAGANQTNDTPAASANGGPIPIGLIPPLDFGDGGFDAPVQCP
jgi:hypothetical protein